MRAATGYAGDNPAWGAEVSEHGCDVGSNIDHPGPGALVEAA